MRHFSGPPAALLEPTHPCRSVAATAPSRPCSQAVWRQRKRMERMQRTAQGLELLSGTLQAAAKEQAAQRQVGRCEAAWRRVQIPLGLETERQCPVPAYLWVLYKSGSWGLSAR